MMRIFFSVVMELIFLQRRKKQLAVKGRISSWVTLKFPLLKKFLQFLFRLVSAYSGFFFSLFCCWRHSCGTVVEQTPYYQEVAGSTAAV